VAALGADGEPLLEIFDLAHLDRSTVTTLPGATYRWRAVHHPSETVPVTEEQQLGVYLDWIPELPLAARGSEILFLGSMPPARQLEILNQCPDAKLVALDTMRDFIAWSPLELDELLQRSDVLFANEAELRALLSSGQGDVIRMARQAVTRWDLRYLILKLGVRGAVIVSAARHQQYPALAGPPVVDPTGAGDALAGGLLGRIAQLGRTDEEALEMAMAGGLAAAQAALSAFGVQGLLEARP